MSLSFSDLITPDTKAEAWEALLAFLEAEGFSVTDWEDGSVPKTLTEGEANAYADACALIAAIAKGGYIDTAEGPWLTLLALAFYAVPRQPAVQTQGTFVLTDAGGGPHDVVAGDLIVGGPGGLTYRNLEDKTVPLNGSVGMPFGAEALGGAYNLANGSSLQLLTSLPTVSVTNPGSIGGSWIVQQGTDEESDSSLRSRCKARWPGTTFMLSTAATYDAAARTASAEVTKVKVFPNDPSPGQIYMLLAGASGSVSLGAITAVADYITERLPLCVTISVTSAVEFPVAIVAELQCEPAYAGTVKAAAETALAALQAALPIGGAPGGLSGYVYRAAIIEALMAAPGMINVNLTSPAANVALTQLQIATFTSTLTVAPLS
jgi:uncharacterized phage protein gp47/JayE